MDSLQATLADLKKAQKSCVIQAELIKVCVSIVVVKIYINLINKGLNLLKPF